MKPKQLLSAILVVGGLCHLLQAQPDTLWTRTYGGISDDYGSSVQQTADGGFIVTGGTNSFGEGGYDVWLIRTDAQGDTLWTRTFGGSSNDHGHSVQQTADGGFVVAGMTSSFGAGFYDIYLIRTDANGDTLWTRTYGGSSDDLAFSVQQTADSGFVVAGFTHSFGAGEYDFWLIRTDAQGDTLWTHTYGGGSNDYGRSVQLTSDGGFVVAGYTSPPSHECCSDVYIIRSDASGDTLWTRTFGGSSNDYGSSVQQTSDGSFVVAGRTDSFGAGDTDVWLIKTDSQGDTLWTRTYGGSSADYGYSVQQTADGGFVVAGLTESFGAGGSDFWLIRLGPEALAAVDPEKGAMPTEFALHPNYPNPFNPATTLRFDLPQAGPVALVVYDLRGREVARLAEGQREAGYHQVTWAGRDAAGREVPTGIYIARLSTPGYTKSIKMVMLK